MGFDYARILKPEGQFDRNACWAASISWWTAAMSQLYKRRTMWQSELISKFDHLTMEDGTMPLAGFRKVCESAEVRAELKYISPAALKSDYTIDSPTIIVFNYPKIGGTHMNVIFDRQDETVECMEPYHPFPGRDGQRTGTYVRRSLSFFANSQEIGVAYLPLADAFTQMQ
ncbi:MAG TPA: hypothetical protein VIL74_08100 [Pyrinomonadaceae bacterium]|jgi:hypothetical protein